MRSQPPTTCPRCGEISPCVDYQTVDIGVGEIAFADEWKCPVHGAFRFQTPEGAVFRDDPPT